MEHLLVSFNTGTAECDERPNHRVAMRNAARSRSYLRAALAIGAACAMSQSAVGQICPPPDDQSSLQFPNPPLPYNYTSGYLTYQSNEHRDGVPSQESCEGEGEFQSICWLDIAHSVQPGGLSQWPYLSGISPGGLNLDLGVGVMAGDFPPVARDVVWSTSPLVPADAPAPLASAGLPERPTVGSRVDLITGVPLLREVDLEIPFGSAVFRHVRTYSEPIGDAFIEYLPTGAGFAGGLIPSHLYWDWCGQGWMMSENPILLIDANWWGIADPTEGVNDHRIYLLPDAHQAIPFIFSDGDGTYVAPPRFDAILSHNGVWSGTCWSVRPSTFKVWLHGGTVLYTFVLQSGDVGYLAGTGGTASAPEAPSISRGRLPAEVLDPTTEGVETRLDGSTAGWGTPHWALCTRIEDRNGNAIRITHCAFERTDCDNEETEGWRECCQSCRTKGQIARVELCALDSDGDEVVEWTLVYVHREFRRHAPLERRTVYDPDVANTTSVQTALVSILAFDRELTANEKELLECPMVPVGLFDVLAPTPGTFWEHVKSQWDADGANTLPEGITRDWRYHIRHWYIDAYLLSAVVGLFSDPSLDAFLAAHDLPPGGGPLHEWIASPELLLVSRLERHGTEVTDSAHVAYRHRQGGPSFGGRIHGTNVQEGQFYRPMQAAWGPDALATVRGGISQLDPPGALSPQEWHGAWPWSFLFVEGDELVSATSTDTTVSTPLLRTADLLLFGWGDESVLPPDDGVVLSAPAGVWVGNGVVGASESPFIEEMVSEYVGLPLTFPAPGGPTWSASPAKANIGGVSLAVVGGEQAAGRTFRVHRYFACPLPQSFPSGLRSWILNGHPFRSMWHEPYRYFELGAVWPSHTDATITPGTEVFHVAVVDEYESLADAAFASNPYGEWRWGLVLGQPAGSGGLPDDRRPLSRRVVRMNAAGYILSEDTWDLRSGQLAVEGLREQFIYEPINPAHQTTPPPPYHPRDAGVRLKEYYTHSWGAADRAGRAPGAPSPSFAESEGLTYVFEYDDLIPANSRIGAVGVRRGSGAGNPVLWTNVWVRDVNRPEHVRYEVQVVHPDAPLPVSLFDELSWAQYVGSSSSGALQAQHGVAVTFRSAEYGADVESFELSQSDPRGSAGGLGAHTPPLHNLATRIVNMHVVHPPSLREDGELYFPVELTHNEYFGATGSTASQGNETWYGVGATTHPPGGSGGTSITGNHAALFANFTRQCQDAQRHLTAVDVELDGGVALPAYGSDAGDIPDGAAFGWSRGPNQADPLNEWVTTLTGLYGVEQVTDHTRRRVVNSRSIDAAPWTNPPDQAMTVTRVYKDVEMGEYEEPGVGSSPIVRAVHSVGEQTWEQNGRPLRAEVVPWTTASGSVPGSLNDPKLWAAGSPLTVLVPSVDGSGRLVALSATDSESPGAAVSASVKYDRYGEVTRERHPDGSIVRNVADSMGRPERVYRGSVDFHQYWGTAPPQGATFLDDMVLTEKRYYGDGLPASTGSEALAFNSARQLIATRRYRDAAASEYAEQWGMPNPAVEDSNGWLETYHHDWRGRQAVVRRHALGGGGPSSSAPILSETHTFYDHANRPVMVATYGAAAPNLENQTRNPVALGPNCELPTAAVLLAGPQTERPRRLSRTIYNLRGLVEEQREYDVSDISANSYLSTVTYYDHAGRATYTRSPSGTIQTFVYDGRGRQIRAATGVDLDGPGGPSQVLELSVTETTYGRGSDENVAFADVGKAISTITRERLHDAGDTPPTLSASATANHVATYSFNWYSLKGELIASASLGTGDPDNRFVPTVEPPARPTDPPSWTNTTPPTEPVLTSQGLPSFAKISTYEYDSQGRQIATVRPDGTRTENQYNNLGQLLLVTENAWAPLVADRAQTAYLYSGSRLVKVAALADPASFSAAPLSSEWTTATSGWQITEFVYGAPVVFGASSGVGSPGPHVATPNSTARLPLNPSLIGAIRFPDHATGLPRSDPDLTFAYYPDGLLATRTDAIGTAFEHSYDELGNRTLSHIDTSGASNAPHAYAASEDFIRNIEYRYDPATGELLWAQATADNGTPEIVATHRFDYDPRGNLVREYQIHGNTIAPPTAPYGTLPPPIPEVPVIEYDWSYASAAGGGDNFNRLAAMVYPPRPSPTGTIPATNPPRRTVTFHHGATGTGATLADQINHRASRISELEDSVHGRSLAEFGYSGSMRRVSFSRGWSTALAAFAVAQSFALSEPAQGYERLDRFGRTAELRFTHASSTLHNYEYAYDLVDNPTARRVTQQPHGGQPHDNQRSNLWTYDGLQRLVAADMGALADFGGPTASIGASTLLPSPRTEDWSLDPLGNHDAREVTVPVSGGTETTSYEQAVNSRNELTGLTTTIGAASPTTDPCIYDLNGCLISDGRYFYEYDAWGRVVKVSDLGTATLGATGALATGQTGGWIIHYTYDALGRLARLQRPLTGFPGYLHTEHYYYDGARRVQEVFHSIDAGSASEQSSEEEATSPTLVTWTDREYIHTAGPGSYVDEFVCEVTSLATSQAPLFPLQDGNYTVVGLVSASGQVARQHTFDAYGELLFGEDLQAAPYSRVGHQGLFFDRLDAAQGSRDLSPVAVGLYQTDNRMYRPDLGRWLQRDPNGTGSLLNATTASGGEQIASSLLPPENRSLFSDGANAHAAYRNRPTGVTDPSGLFIGYIGTMSSSAIAGAIRDDQIDSGVKAFMSLNAMLQGAAFDMALLVSWAEEWGQGDEFASEYQLARLAGPGSGGEPDVDNADDPLQALVMAGIDKHHFIARFLRGVDRTIGLQQAMHRAYHAMLRAAWKSANLRAINSRGTQRWRNRLAPGSKNPVSAEDLATIRRVLIQVADDFVAKFPGVADDMARLTREFVHTIGTGP